MDPRHPSHPFARPHSQQQTRDARYAPVPPSPFASQPSTPRSETLHKNDPFLRRRNDLDEERRSPSLGNVPRSLGLPQTSQYPSTSVSAFPDAALNNDHARRSSFGAGGTLYSDRRIDGYGSYNGDDSRDRSLPHSLSSVSSNFASGSYEPARAAQADAQRRFTGQAGSPTALGASIDHQAGHRQMLPPSPHSSQAQHHGQNAQARNSVNPFSNGRDLPIPLNNHRPSSSMSISSMLGSDPVKSSRETATNGNGNSSAASLTNLLTSPITQAGQAGSPPRLSQGSSAIFERSSSPGKHQVYNASANRPSRSFSSGIDRPASFLGQPVSPSAGRHDPIAGSQVSQLSPVTGINHFQDRRPPEIKQSQRPSSQPNSNQGHRDLSGILAKHPDALRRYRESDKHLVDLDQVGGGDNSRRAGGFDSSSQPLYGVRLTSDGRHMPLEGNKSQKLERLNGMRHSSMARSRPNAEPVESELKKETIYSDISRPSEQFQSLSTTQSPYSPESLRRLQKERQGLRQRSPGYSPSKLGRAPHVTEEMQTPVLSGNSGLFGKNLDSREIEIADLQQFKDEMANHRKSSLATLMEQSRNRGRFSPLPQAVQGAQGRTSGPASDPGIKNEFARMFSGIGSGVGSAGPNGSGTNTPFPPPSPTMSHGQRRTPSNNRTEIALPKPVSTSTTKRRSRKPREEAILIENGDGGDSHSKAAKRSKTGHHYHPYPHHHRHHHHVDDDGSNGAITPVAVGGRRVHTPVQGASTGPHRHHHHGVHRHHHHPPQPPRLPAFIIKNEAVLNSIRMKPRAHLGSIMYSSSLEPATSVASQASKLGYSSTPNPLPRYEGKENCTFTVRIPRFYLDNQEREDICRRRALWGTGIYTDDSDPIAAAIHSGWIQGFFGDDVDLDMLELPSSNEQENPDLKMDSDPRDVFTCVPARPMVPPTDKDLHLTLLVLPPLEKYASHIAHGIKSRDWGNTHDGMSFKIEKMEWVDGQQNDRTGESQRQRMRLAQLQQGKAGGPAIRPFNGSLGTRGGRETKTAIVAVGA